MARKNTPPEYGESLYNAVLLSLALGPRCETLTGPIIVACHSNYSNVSAFAKGTVSFSFLFSFLYFLLSSFCFLPCLSLSTIVSLP
jgi:hypothetical protein